MYVFYFMKSKAYRSAQFFAKLTDVIESKRKIRVNRILPTELSTPFGDMFWVEIRGGSGLADHRICERPETAW